MTDYTESQLVLPALEAMSLTPHGYFSTSELIRVLESKMTPSGYDAEILYGRRDTHFSQKVRNLKSNRRLLRYGWALYVDGGFVITPKGRSGNDPSELAAARSLRAREFRWPARSAGRFGDGGSPTPTRLPGLFGKSAPVPGPLRP